MTGFTLRINLEDGNQFTGEVSDDLSSGGMQGIGTVVGEFEGKKISFTKRMPQSSVMFVPAGKRVKSKAPHAPVYYSGRMTTENSYAGTWKFKRRLFFLFGIIPLPLKAGGGTWEMQPAG